MFPVDPWRRTADRVVNRYVQHPELIRSLLERIGAQHVEDVGPQGFRSTCPLHAGDNTQAFAVWIDRGFPFWQCYTRACGRGGLVKLLMKKYNADFATATTWLAQMAGIRIDGPILQVSPEQLQEESLEMMRRRLKIGEVSQPNIFDESWVAQARQGWRHPAAATAIQFLTGPYGTRTAYGDKCKQLPWQVLRKFDVGFVPAAKWVIPDPQDPRRRSGWFEDRIAIPWRDWDGRCIGFAGRRIDGQDYLKYKTFTGTHRNFALFGLHQPETKRAIAAEKEVYLVEGYTDVFRAWSLGIHNIVGVGGTDIAKHQLMLLGRFDLRWITTYLDGDAGGVAGSRRMSDQLKEVSKVRCGCPPPGLDPDDLLDRDSFLRGIKDARIV